MLLEVIVQSVEDARAAEEGGADRLEVVRDIVQDGLTPPSDLVKQIASATGLPLRVMVRQSAGFGLTSLDELARLRDAVSRFASAGVDGVVMGFSSAGALDLEIIEAVLSAAPGLPATLHRAFDTVSDPVAAIASARRVSQIDRILTSAGGGDWAARCERLARYSAAAAPLITIVAGGGVDADGIRSLARCGCVREVHVGRAARIGNVPTGPVSARQVRALKELARGV